jgi:hypothetical protein
LVAAAQRLSKVQIVTASIYVQLVAVLFMVLKETYMAALVPEMFITELVSLRRALAAKEIEVVSAMMHLLKIQTYLAAAAAVALVVQAVALTQPFLARVVLVLHLPFLARL